MMLNTRWVISTFFLFLLISILSTAGITHAAIVFRFDGNNGQGDIYVMNDDGSRVRQLTNSPLWDVSPRWSPDGKHILFRRDLGGGGQQLDIFIIDADGSNERRLTDHPKNDGRATWSPDGQHIAFSSSRSGNIEIYIMEVANGTIRQLTKNEAGEAYASAPNWSPDGQHILHEQILTGGGRHIYITDVNGKKTRPFLKGPQPHLDGNVVISKYAPRWSPNGQHVMYYKAHLRFEPARVVRLANHLIIVNKHGRNPKQLNIPKNWRIHSAHWAGNGTEILFAAEENGLQNLTTIFNYDIYRYHNTSGKITQITDTPHAEVDPHWVSGTLSVSPKGKQVKQWAEIKIEK